jgi:thioredoxin 1
MSSKTQKALIVTALVAAVAVVIIAKTLSGPDETPVTTSRDSGEPNKPLPRLVDLGGDTCTVCKAMAPILDELKTELAGKVRIERLNVHENPDLIIKYDVSIVPTQIFYDASGREVCRNEGFMGRQDILAQWKQLGVDLAQKE